MLSQLVYFSERGDLGPGGIQHLVDQAREKNARCGVTGAILFDPRYFLQCLEGERQDVTSIFGRIMADERHDNVSLMSVRDIEHRDFPDWTMGLMTSTDSMMPIFRQFLTMDELTPQSLSCESAVALLKSLRDSQFTV